MTGTDLPDGWRWCGGEANRPLHTGGYYLHVAIYIIWENQYKRHYYEARIDTADYTQSEGPRTHALEITRREEDKLNGTSRDIKRVETGTVSVDDRNDEADQQAAEDTIHERAIAAMERLTDE